MIKTLINRSKKISAITLLSGLIAFLTVACSEDTVTISGNNEINVNKLKSAKDLVSAAEALIQGDAPQLAEPVLIEAIKLDPDNIKANFLLKLISPKLELRGLYSRLEPLISKDKESLDALNELRAGMDRSATFDMLFNSEGKAPIKNEADLQALLDRVNQRYADLALFLSKNKSAKIDLNITNNKLQKEYRSEFENRCVFIESEPGVYKYTSVPTSNSPYACNINDIYKVKLNRADLEVLHQITNGIRLYTSIVNRYTLNGLSDVLVEGKDKHLTNENIWNYLSQIEGFGLLRRSSLIDIQEIGFDLISSSKWAIKQKEDSCSEQARRENLFAFDFCTDEKEKNNVNNEIATLENILKGNLIDVMIKNTDEETQIRPLAFFDNPTQNIKVLSPTFDRCGNNIIAIKDDSLNGIFPNLDANKALFVHDIKEDCLD